MARVPIMARGNISLARGMHCCPIILSFNRLTSVYCEEHVCIYTYPTALWLYVSYRWYQMIWYWKWNVYTNRERCEVLTGCLLLGRQPGGDWPNTWHRTKCLLFAFQTGSSSSPSYFHVCSLNAFVEEAFIINVI